MKKIFALIVVMVMVLGLAGPAFAQGKIGYVDLRRAFYEYEETKDFEGDMTAISEERNAERTKKINEITKLRDEAELLKGAAKTKKDQEINDKLAELQTYDAETRQMLLNKKNDMFRVVIDKIAGVVKEIGNKEDYDYILDSRNIMFAKDAYDLTDKVISEINKN